jgi:dTMP kinase
MFVTFEGGEGCGKTTQIKLLASKLESLGYDVLCVREPGGTYLGDRIRGMLLDPESEMCDEAEALLFAASRIQLVKTVILPALEEGKVVISDRFIDSSLAYQGWARGVGPTAIMRVNWFVRYHMPDLTLLLDIDPEEGLRRAGRRALFDRIEQEELAFHQSVRRGFLDQAEKEPRIEVIDATPEPEKVEKAVWDQVQKRLPA